MTAAGITGRGYRLAALFALILVLLAGPAPVAPSVMQARLVQAMLMGAGPGDLCGMGDEADPVHCAACLPLLAGLGAEEAGAVALPCGWRMARAFAPPGLQPVLRDPGPGAIRDPPWV